MDCQEKKYCEKDRCEKDRCEKYYEKDRCEKNRCEKVRHEKKHYTQYASQCNSNYMNMLDYDYKDYRKNCYANMFKEARDRRY